MKYNVKIGKNFFGLLFLSVILVLMTVFIYSFTAIASPVSENGALSVSGSHIVNKNGETFVIKGVSTHGLAWYPQYVNKDLFRELRDKWGVNTIRLAMYTAEYGGYCNGGKSSMTAIVKKGVQYARELGMYVIIDWHILSDGNPLTYLKESKKFFKAMAKKYKNCSNVLYEICNEPNGSGGTWKNIRSYGKAIIKIIRKYAKKSIIIVGTPNWSQDIQDALENPLSGKNIVYALHFYAGTHTQWLRKQVKKVLKKGLCVLVTEFGVSRADGSGGVYISQANKWMELLDTYGVGRVAWSLSNKNESSALIKSSCGKVSGLKKKNLSKAGKWLVNTYGGSLS